MIKNITIIRSRFSYKTVGQIQLQRQLSSPSLLFLIIVTIRCYLVGLPARADRNRFFDRTRVLFENYGHNLQKVTSSNKTLAGRKQLKHLRNRQGENIRICVAKNCIDIRHYLCDHAKWCNILWLSRIFIVYLNVESVVQNRGSTVIVVGVRW